jgi:hypothetical protein
MHLITRERRLTTVGDQKGILLTEIVTLNQHRILGRLRSKHSPRSKKGEPGGQAIIEQLHSTIMKVAKSWHYSDDYQRIREVVTTWWKYFRELESLKESEARSEKGVHLLVRLVSDLSLRFDVKHFTKILCPLGFRDSPWPGSRHERILRTYSKISQYQQAADYIGYMVQKLSYWELRNASSAPYTLHPLGAQPDRDRGEGLLRRSLTTGPTKGRKEFQSTVVERLGKSLPKIEASIKKATATHKKVHAEIQLLYYYAQHPEIVLKPRIICSNKEACYLCYLFFTVHGLFHTPRSHGNF